MRAMERLVLRALVFDAADGVVGARDGDGTSEESASAKTLGHGGALPCP